MAVRPVFSYWTGSDLSVHHELMSEWRAQFPHFTIFGDAVVTTLVEKYFPDRLDLYNSIRIPTAKSDIALLALLYEFGGLYIDCHCGILDADGIRARLDQLLECDAILVNRRLRQKPARDPDIIFLINSMIFARPKLDIVFRVLQQALENFHIQFTREEQAGSAEYDIWTLSGPGLVTATLLEPESHGRALREEYTNRVRIIREEEAPIRRGRFRHYSSLSLHWSERQKVEPLFDHARAHPGDLPREELERAVAVSEQPALLKELVTTSRRVFGVFTKHYAYTINYPWVVSRLTALPPGSRVLDVASGVSPVPVYLAEHGLLVDCVDNSDIVRTLPPGEDWNDWGFFDYRTLHPNLAAYNCSILDFEPSHAYDAIYSISSIAHFPSAVREQTLRNCAAWLTAGGRLILAIDLIPESDILWTGGSGELPAQHGTYHDVVDQVRSLGLSITETRILRKVHRSRIDLFFLVAEKSQS